MIKNLFESRRVWWVGEVFQIACVAWLRGGGEACVGWNDLHLGNREKKLCAAFAGFLF
jgi:hypothetical protein